MCRFKGMIFGCILSGVLIPVTALQSVALEQAHTLYFDQYKNSKPGLIKDGGLVFVIVSEPVRQSSSRRSLELKARMKVRQILASEFSGREKLSGSGSSTLDQLLFQEQTLAMNNLGSRVLENRPDGDNYRYVVVLEEAEIARSAREQSTSRAFSPKEIAEQLSILERGKAYELLSSIFMELNLPEIAMQWQRRDFSEKGAGYISRLLSAETGRINPLSAVKAFPGQIRFDSSYDNQPGVAYQQAVSYFEQGIKLEEIVQLLEQSLNQAPGHVASWQYLGAALQAREDWNYASVAYLQWLSMEPSSVEAAAKLAESLFKGGFQNEARRFAPYLKLFSETNPFARKFIELTRDL
ncbi:tetratricopeptide repeat protein [Endozoicomonas numazuensis]|uniref:Uncharacterized protein n=1 Tax=Endozoicomonas numazuensis TaxID=1137799 RepID=A0A081ND78_9GAMM|nr:hypothetical protein [Endozoicomonas numazuensis]KEQ16401.1 hypothetical protein GZ78_21265 [Endozoicomonas numazuensis]